MGGRQQIAAPLPLTKKRCLRFARPTPAGLHAARDVLLGISGVISASSQPDGVIVEYDLRAVSLGQIEATITEAGFVFCAGIHAWQRALWRFKETNEINNATRPAGEACCNRPPARKR